MTRSGLAGIASAIYVVLRGSPAELNAAIPAQL